MKSSPFVRLLAAVVCVLLLSTVLAGATVKTTAGTRGWWTNAGTWTPPGVPTLADTAIVQAGHTVHVRNGAAAKVLINNGIIDHPLGSITSDKRVRVLLMVGAVDSLINNGGIYGYNARGGLTNRYEPCPPSVLITCTGGLGVVWPPNRPTGVIRNNGIIRAGDAFRRGMASPGGTVYLRGRPRFWWGLYPDIRVWNDGEISGGRGRGSALVGMAGGAVVGISPAWPHRPFTLVDNNGVIQGGKYGWRGGWTHTVARYPGMGGVIDSRGGPIYGGEDVTPAVSMIAQADTIKFAGPGSHFRNARRIAMVGPPFWPGPSFNAQNIIMRNLDPDAIHALPDPSSPAVGGTFYWWTQNTDVRGNPAGTVVIRADNGSSIPAGIYPFTRTMQIDAGVTLPNITSPATSPNTWLFGANDEDAIALGRQEHAFPPELALVPEVGLYEHVLDDTLVPPEERFWNSGSPGDTVTLWLHVLSNKRLEGEIEVTTTDSLGYVNLTPYQTVRNDSFLFSTARINFRIPMWANYGDINKVYVQATYNDSFPADSYFDVYVVGTPNIISPSEPDSIVDMGADDIRAWAAWNEGRLPGNFEFETTDTEGWEVHTEILSMMMPAHSESTVNVVVNVPPGTASGTVDTVCVTMRDMADPQNYDTSCWVVTYDGGTGIEGGTLGKLTLEQNNPNPFNPKTEIRFTLPMPTEVSLDVYDIAGRHVRSIVAGERMEAGDHVTAWDGHDGGGHRVSSGVYFYRLKTEEREAVRKMVLLK